MARDLRRIDMRTDGFEQRQFLYAEDCAEGLETLANNYNRIPRDCELHITSFEWVKIIEIAKIVSELYPGTKIIPAVKQDNVQQGHRNEADETILQYWKPKTSLIRGIKLVNEVIRVSA
jgi:nucleoside-diphosphate-sugar epimerase